MPLQYTPIVLGAALVIGIGVFIYNAFVNSTPQAHSYGQQDRDYNYYGYDDAASVASGASSVYGEDDGNSSTRKRANKKDRCSICLGSLKEKVGNLKELTCGHIYHNNCIVQWLHSNKTCPVCRATV